MPEYTVRWGGRGGDYWDAILSEFKGRDVAGLEIGTFEGKGAAWFLDNVLTHPQSSLVCVDPFVGLLEYTDADRDALYNRCISNLSSYSRVKIVKGRSQDVLRTMDEKFHFIYIDGDHHAKAVLDDAVLAFRLLHYGGIMIFDDYEWQDPREPALVDAPKLGIDAFLRAYQGYYNVVYKGYQIVIRKIRQ